MKKIFTLLFLLAVCCASTAQISTQGKDFWVNFQPNYQAGYTITVYVASKNACSGTIENPSTGFSSSFSVAANSVATVSIPVPSVVCTNAETPEYTAVHITASDTVSVFGLNYYDASTDGTFFIPTPSLGVNYMVCSYAPLAASYPSQIGIWAVEDSTDIEIITTQNSTGGIIAGVPLTIRLNKGQAYRILSGSDLTGSTVRSLKTCTPIAVMSGTACANVPLSCPYCNHLFEQMLPIETWGKTFYLAPTRRKPTDYFRVMAGTNGTNVTIGTTPYTLNKGQFVESFISAQSVKITSDQPVAVIGYTTGSNCSSGVGDPSMYWVSPTEQTLTNLVFSTVSFSGLDSQYVNIIVKTTDTARLFLNGSKISASFNVNAAYPDYAYAQYRLTTATNNIICDSGFIANVYGYGPYNAYSYSAGASLRGVETNFVIGGKKYTDEDTLKLCYGRSYPFGASSPYNNISKIFWSFGDGDTITHLTPTHAYTDSGLFQLNAYLFTTSTCIANTDTLVGYVTIRPPEVHVMADTSICRGDSLMLTASGLWAENNARRFYHWYKGSTYIGQGQPKVAPAADTQYTVIYTDSCATVNDTGFVTVHVKNSGAVALNRDTTLCLGQSLLLHAALSSPDTGITYTWTSGLGGSGFTDSLVTPAANTIYAVKISGGACLSTGSTDSVQVFIRPALDITLRPDTTICQGQPVSLNAIGSGGDSTYTFTWNNSLGTGAAKTVSPVSTTQYRVIITDGCTITPDTAFTTIHVRPALDISLTPDTTTCFGQFLNLAAVGYGGDSTYTFTWDHSLGTGVTKGVSPITTTTYRVIITDGCTVKPDTAFVTVTPRAPLDITLHTDTVICIGQSVNFTAQPSGGKPPYTLTWSHGLGTGTSKTVSPASTIQYSVTVSDGCSPGDAAYSRVYVRPPLEVALPPDTTLCQGQSVNLNALGKGGDSSYTFTWNNGGGTGPVKNVSPASTTQYQVIISDNCTLQNDTAYTTVHIRPALEVVLNPDTLICRGNSVLLTPEGAGGYSTYTFTWNNNLGTGPNSTVTPDTTTTYQVIISDGCTSKEDTAYTTVGVRPGLDIVLSADTTICNGNTVTLQAEGYGGDSTYTIAWTGMDTGTTLTISPSTTTTYEAIITDACTIRPDTAYSTINVRPGLQLTPGQTDTTICQGGEVTLWGIPHGGDSSYTYNWLPVSGTSATLLVTPDTTSTYGMILEDGCTLMQDTQWITVFVRPAPQLGVSNDTLICIGEMADMSAWGTGGDSSYVITWTGIGTGVSVQEYPAANTAYQVILDDQCSATGDTAWINVNVRPPLKADIRPDTTICTGQAVDLWVLAHGGDSTYAYTWDNGLGNTPLENVIPTASTTYRLVLSDACTQKNDTVYTTVYVRPPLQLALSNDTSICAGEPALVRALGSGGDSSYSYSWDHGLGNANTQLVQPAVTTVYTVTLDDQCSPGIQGQVTVTVEQKPQVNFTPTPAGVCLGDSITFNNQTAGNANYSYIWRFGDTKISTLYGPVYTYKQTGPYSVTLVAISALCRDSVSKPVNIFPNPVASFTATPAVTDLRTPEITFTNHSALGYTYNWDFGDLIGSASAENTTYSYLDTGYYLVTLTVNTVNNCTDTAMRLVRINDYYTFFAPNSFSPNDNNKNEYFEVKGHGWISYHISIYNRWGEMVFESNDPAKSWSGKVGQTDAIAPQGLYYYTIEVADVFMKRHFYEGTITLLK